MPDPRGGRHEAAGVRHIAGGRSVFARRSARAAAPDTGDWFS
jgi:hypothetical protein